MKIKQTFKSMDSLNKVLLIGSAIVIILLIVNFIMTLDYIIKFENKTKNTNGRWLEVEEIITGVEDRVDLLNEKVTHLETKVNELHNIVR